MNDINNFGGQINLAKDNAVIYAEQTNKGLKESDLDKIINDVTSDISYFNKEDAETILDTFKLIKEELSKPKPNSSRLRNCVTLLGPMISIANGVPQVAEKIEKIISYISKFIG